MAFLKDVTLVAALALPALALGQAVERSAPPAESNAAETQPPMLGIHWARGFEANARVKEASKRSNSSPLMIYHGGKIMPSVIATAIFWGTSWPTDTSDKIAGLDSWYEGFGDSDYAKTSDEYTGSNGQVGPDLSYWGHLVDGSPSVSGSNTGAVLAEVCKMIPNPDPNGNGYYAVYTDTPRGHANYCAYHSYGTCNGTPVQFAYFFNLDGDPGCDPNDTSGLHSEGLAALANVSGHELSEARTDPATPGAWYHASGEENGDKCAWTFGVPLVTFGQGARATQWKIQGEWSNAAYLAGTGYPNSSGQRGCLSGQ